MPLLLFGYLSGDGFSLFFPNNVAGLHCWLVVVVIVIITANADYIR